MPTVVTSFALEQDTGANDIMHATTSQSCIPWVASTSSKCHTVPHVSVPRGGAGAVTIKLRWSDDFRPCKSPNTDPLCVNGGIDLRKWSFELGDGTSYGPSLIGRSDLTTWAEEDGGVGRCVMGNMNYERVHRFRSAQPPVPLCVLLSIPPGCGNWQRVCYPC